MASTEIKDLLIRIRAETDQAMKQLGEVEKKTTTVGSVMKGVGVAALAAGAVVVAALGKMIMQAAAAELSTARLNAVLASTKGVAGMTSESLLGLRKELAQVTMFSAGAQKEAQTLLLTFTGIGKDVFPAAQEAVLNMSTVLGQDLKSSSIQLGKALQDPILGVTALRRAGVNFNEAAKDTIKAMVEMGDVAGAQKFILAELETEFGGAAKAAGQTFTGQLTILQNGLKGVGVEIGTQFLPALTEIIRSINANIPKIKEVLSNLISTVGGAISSVYNFINENKSLVATLLVTMGVIKLITLDWGAMISTVVSAAKYIYSLGVAAYNSCAGITAMGLSVKGALIEITLLIGAIVAANILIKDFKNKQIEAHYALKNISMGYKEATQYMQGLGLSTAQITKAFETLSAHTGRSAESLIYDSKKIDEVVKKLGTTFTKMSADAVAAEEELAQSQEKAAAAALEFAKKRIAMIEEVYEKIFKLTHNETENQIYELNKQRDAYLQSGVDKLKVTEWYNLEIKKINEESNKNQVDSMAKTYTSLVEINKITGEEFILQWNKANETIKFVLENISLTVTESMTKSIIQISALSKKFSDFNLQGLNNVISGFGELTKILKEFGEFEFNVAIPLAFNQIIESTKELYSVFAQMPEEIFEKLSYLSEKSKKLTDISLLNTFLGQFKTLIDTLKDITGIQMGGVALAIQSVLGVIKELATVGNVFKEKENDLKKLTEMDQIFTGKTISNFASFAKDIGELTKNIALIGKVDVMVAINLFIDFLEKMSTVSTRLKYLSEVMSAFVSVKISGFTDFIKELGNLSETFAEFAKKDVTHISDDIIASIIKIELIAKNIEEVFGTNGTFRNGFAALGSGYFDKLKTLLQNTFGKINDAFAGVSLENVNKFITSITSLIGIFEDTTNNVSKALLTNPKQIAERLKIFFDELILLAGEIQKYFGNSTTSVGSYVGNSFEKMLDTFKDLNEKFKDISLDNLNKFLQQVTQLKELMWGVGKGQNDTVLANGNPFSAFEKMMKSILDSFDTDAVKKAIEKIKSVIQEFALITKTEFYSTGEEVKKNWLDMVQTIQTSITLNLVPLQTAMITASQSIRTAFLSDKQAISDGWNEAISKVSQSTTDFQGQITEMLDFLKAVASGEGINTSGIANTFIMLTQVVSDLTNQLYKSIFEPILTSFGETLMKIPQTIRETLIQMMSDMRSELISLVTTLADAFISKWTVALTTFKATWKSSLEEVKSNAMAWAEWFNGWIDEIITDALLTLGTLGSWIDAFHTYIKEVMVDLELLFRVFERWMSLFLEMAEKMGKSGEGKTPDLRVPWIIGNPNYPGPDSDGGSSVWKYLNDQRGRGSEPGSGGGGSVPIGWRPGDAIPPGWRPEDDFNSRPITIQNLTVNANNAEEFNESLQRAARQGLQYGY